MISSTDFRLKFPAVICRFSFGRRTSYSLIFFIMLLCASSASAFFSDGKIDDDFSYRSLRVEILKTKRGGCYLEGEILNKTKIVQEDISVTVYAYDYFDHSLWKEMVKIDIVDPFYNSGKGYIFRKKMRSCEVPAKFRFKVTGVKKQEAKKGIPAKPEHKKSVSKNSRQKDDSGAVDVHSGHGKSPSVSQPLDNSALNDGISDSVSPVVPARRYLIILTNGKEIITDSCREADDAVFFYRNGGEVRINRDQVSEIRKLD